MFWQCYNMKKILFTKLIMAFKIMSTSVLKNKSQNFSNTLKSPYNQPIKKTPNKLILNINKVIKKTPEQCQQTLIN